MTVRGRYLVEDHFLRPMPLSTTAPAGGSFGWTAKKTASAGTPTYTTTASGLVLTMASNSEAEVVTAYQNDVLVFPLGNIRTFEFTAQVAGIDSVTTVLMGLAAAENDTIASVAGAAWFRINGATDTGAINCETYDGATRTTVGQESSLTNVNKRFLIDFSQGISDIRFEVDGQPLVTTTKFSLSALTATQGLQAYFQIQKASGTGVGSLTLRDVRIQGIFAD